MGIFFNKALNKITIQLLQKETSFSKISIEETMLDVQSSWSQLQVYLARPQLLQSCKNTPFCLFLSETDVK